MTDLRWPLVGLDRELAMIRQALDGCLGRVCCSWVHLTWCGQTRLLRAAVVAARSHGYRVEVVAATRAAATIPLGALSHLLPVEPPQEQPHQPAQPTAASSWLFRQIEDQLRPRPAAAAPLVPRPAPGRGMLR